MDWWKTLLIKATLFVLIIPLLGYVLLVSVEFVQNAWKSNNRRKKWMAMALIVGVYLALNGWFRY